MATIALTIVNGQNGGDRFEFPLGPVLHLGRNKENDLVIPDPRVAKFHATLEPTPEGLVLNDLNTHGGTYLMGFPATREILQPQDEFRLGDTVLSVSWEAPKTATSTPSHSKGLKLPLLAGAAAILLLVLFLIPDGGEKKPAQEPRFGSSAVFGGSKQLSFQLPAGALLIEFEAKTETPLAVYRDEALVGRVGISAHNWSRYQLILPDQLEGKTPALLFKPSESKHWQIRRVRERSLPLEDEATCLAGAAALADVMTGAMDGVSKTLFKLQSCLGVDKLVGAGIFIPSPAASETPQKVGEILRELEIQRVIVEREDSAHHLEVLSDIVSSLDAELWQIALGQLRAGLLANKAKNYKQALTSYKALDQIFPDKRDYRLVEAKSTLEKAIPHTVLKKAKNYLRGTN